MQRKTAILLAANAQFAHFGFRGASLREIAREAGVSLTLLNHHFGSKFQLLVAVIDAHRGVLDDRVQSLQALLADPRGFTVRDMVQAWVRLGFEVAAQPDGEVFLRLLARLLDDPEEEAVNIVRDRLEEHALLFIDALLRCHPEASRYAAACAYQCFNAALMKFLIGSRRLLRLARAEEHPAPAAPAAPLPLPIPQPVDRAAPELAGDVATVERVEAAPVAGPPESAPVSLREADQALLGRFLVAGIEALLRH